MSGPFWQTQTLSQLQFKKLKLKLSKLSIKFVIITSKTIKDIIQNQVIKAKTLMWNLLCHI